MTDAGSPKGRSRFSKVVRCPFNGSESWIITQMLHGMGIFTYMNGEKWPHSRGNVGKSFLHGASGLLFKICLF